MATRFYTLFQDPGIPSVGPFISWDNTGYYGRLKAGTESGSYGLFSTYTAETSTQNPWTIGCTGFLTDELAAQTISGTVTAQLIGYEGSSNSNTYFQCGVFVVDYLGNLKATLIAATDDDVELATSYKNRTVFNVAAITPYACSARDRIYFEVGLTYKNSKDTSYFAIPGFVDNSATDLPVDDTDTSTAKNTWFEFSMNLAFYVPDMTIDIPVVAITLTTQTPTYQAVIGTVYPPVASIQLLANAPDGIIGEDVLIVPPTANMGLVAQTPLVPPIIVVPAALMTLTSLTPSTEGAGRRIRKEINVLNNILSATSGNSATSNERICIESDAYSDATFYFEIVGYTSSSLAVDITLRRVGTSTDDATCSIPAGTTTPTRIRSASFTPYSTTCDYAVYIPNTAGATKYVRAARVVILQATEEGVLTKTETQIELCGYTTGGANNDPPQLLTGAKFWTFEGFDSVDSRGSFCFDVVYNVSSGAYGLCLSLMSSSMEYASFSEDLGIIDASDPGVSTTLVRVRIWPRYWQPEKGRLYTLGAYRYPAGGGSYNIFSVKLIHRQGDAGHRALLEGHSGWATQARINSTGQFMIILQVKNYNKAGQEDYARFLWASHDYGETFRPVHYGVHTDVCITDDMETIYLVTYTGSSLSGLYQSTDGGLSWERNTGMPGTTSNSNPKVICSRDGQYVYFTINALYSGSASRLYRSDNYGETFECTFEGTQYCIRTTLFCDATGQYVSFAYQASGSTGILKYSSDYGQTFSDITDALWTGKSEFALYDMWRDGVHLLAGWTATDYTYSIAISHDRGENWTEITWRPPSCNLWEMSFYTADNALYGRFYSESFVYEDWVSYNDGVNWEAVTDDIYNSSYGYKPRVNDDASIILFGLFSAAAPGGHSKVWRENVTKTQSQYLIESALNTSTGLANKDTYFDPDEWLSISAVKMRHALDASTDTSDSAKLQTDPNGAPADITGSEITGAYHTISDYLETPSPEQTIDVNVLNQPIHASRLLIDYMPVEDEQVSPIVALDTADEADFGFEPLPTVEFTGTDDNGDDVSYELQIDTIATFDSVADYESVEAFYWVMQATGMCLKNDYLYKVYNSGGNVVLRIHQDILGQDYPDACGTPYYSTLKNIIADDSYLYVSHYMSTFSPLVRIPIDEFSVSDMYWKYVNLAESQQYAGAMAQDDDYVYVLLNMNPAQLVRIGKADWDTDKDTLTLTGMNGAYGLCCDDNYVYVASMQSSPAYPMFTKVSKASWTVSASKVLASYDTVRALAVDANYLYYVTQAYSRIGRLALSDFDTYQQSAPGSNYGWECMVIDDTYLYAGSYGTTPIVGKMLLSDFSTWAEVDLSSLSIPSGTSVSALCLDEQGEYLYGSVNEHFVRMRLRKPRIRALSETDAGFTNLDNETDIDPFTSGQSMSYIVQPDDALENGTYYWRVRGRDPGGTKKWGEWSETRQFSAGFSGELAIPPPVDMVLTPLNPKIEPPNIFVNIVDMSLVTIAPELIVIPPVQLEVPAASMPFNTRLITHYWGVPTSEELTMQRIFICVLTGAGDGLDDLVLPISSFQAEITDVLLSYASCVVPDVAGYEAEIMLRQNGEIVIYAGYRLASGAEMLEEIFRVTFEDMNVYKGSRRESLAISGYSELTVGTAKERTAESVTKYVMLSSGKRQIVCDEVDLFLRCGDTFIYGEGGNDYIFVGSIGYEVNANPVVTRMTVTEL